MHRDLLDALRCPHPHDESWLVAMVTRADGPQLVTADLACPVCGADVAIRDGIAEFAGPVPAIGAGAPEVDRLAALLGVTGSPLPVLLTGAYARAGAGLAALIEAPQLWLDAPADAAPTVPLLSRLRGAPRLPLGVETLAAAAVDAVHAGDAMLASIVRAVRVGGRIVAPASVPLPATLTLLARDDQEWVAETTTRASGLIELRRRA
ncbi:MAG: hypothetical protein K2R93_16900 [Gemmatimonadaceae bacterium]|nr:hypothetical protein [Gemmatimonadaceae bacterium]